MKFELDAKLKNAGILPYFKAFQRVASKISPKNRFLHNRNSLKSKAFILLIFDKLNSVVKLIKVNPITAKNIGVLPFVLGKILNKQIVVVTADRVG